MTCWGRENLELRDCVVSSLEGLRSCRGPSQSLVVQVFAQDWDPSYHNADKVHKKWGHLLRLESPDRLIFTHHQVSQTFRTPGFVQCW